MKIVCLHDKAEIETYLRREIALNIYSLGDLDDFYWPHTQWYALKTAGEIQVYRVAAIGNVTTHPNYRNRGLAKAITAALCQSLVSVVDHIGLNVKQENAPPWDVTVNWASRRVVYTMK